MFTLPLCSVHNKWVFRIGEMKCFLNVIVVILLHVGQSHDSNIFLFISQLYKTASIGKIVLNKCFSFTVNALTDVYNFGLVETG